MIRQERSLSPEHASRRDFLKTSLAAAAIGTLPLARTAHAAGSDIIRIGLIGCGNRGPGAAVNAMNVDPGVRLVAMADIFDDHVQSKRAILKREKPNQVDVDDAHCFSGLNGYRHVIESADVVLIACAAKYHCVYLLAAVEAGKHAFVEKPHAIDPVGARQIMAAGEIAKQKNLSILSGLHCRFYPGFQETVHRIHDGEIGDIVTTEETFLRGPYNIVNRNPKLNEVEFQFSAQMHFTWLSGDDVSQSLSHNLDRSAWVMKEQTPVKAHGLGGRSASFGEIYGTTFDHHAVVYEYADGVRTYASCNTQNGCYGDATSTIFGTKGRAYLTHGLQCGIIVNGKPVWKYKGPGGNPYDLEHKAFSQAIRSANPLNCADYMARNALVAIMGQLACYSGRELTWDQVSKSAFVFMPKPQDVRLDMESPVKPDEKGNYPVSMPGITEFKI
jgi:myo-inositol 2-dehydrogenase/D-chiro-inositol 1-dehydrogenase